MEVVSLFQLFQRSDTTGKMIAKDTMEHELFDIIFVRYRILYLGFNFFWSFRNVHTTSLYIYIYIYMNISRNFQYVDPWKNVLQYVCTSWVTERYKSMTLEMTKSVANTYDTWDTSVWIRYHWNLAPWILLSQYCTFCFPECTCIESKEWDWVKIQYVRFLKYHFEIDTYDHHVLTRRHWWDTLYKSSCQEFWQSSLNKIK